jgi:type I restriction enzyme S subunit
MEKQRNIPELRFPEFEGEWEKKKLGEVAEKITDGTHFSPKSFDHGEFLYITSKNVKDGYMELSNAQYISYEDHTNIYKRCDVKKGDILLTKDGTIGQSCINELEIEFSLLSSVAFIRTLSNYSNYFIYQLIVSDIGQREIESQIAGQALRRITLQKINNFEFHFPSLPEQSKIATFLTAVDEKLQALKKKKSLLEVYKKGVMQKLFSQELRFKREDGKKFGDWEEKQLGEVVKIFSGNSPNKPSSPISFLP